VPLTGTVPGTGTVPQTGGAAREVFGDSPLRGQSLAKAGPGVIHQTVTADRNHRSQITVNRWLLRHGIEESMAATMAPDMVNPGYAEVPLSLDHPVGDGLDRGEPACELVVEPVPRGQLGRFGVRELRLVAVGPDEDLEW
jgi:hypothetical protein